ncbi:MAG: HAMP domain-containing protein [Candidatus Lindowbacteria bacterium]|nr:HAMP domain-containing protein [Candidatus Lindowbacteria bacterium]
MSRLGLRLAAIFAVVVAATIAFVTARSVFVIRTANDQILSESSHERIVAIEQEFEKEATGIIQKILPLSEVRELRFRVSTGLPTLPGLREIVRDTETEESAPGPVDPVGLQRFIEEILPVTGLDSLEVLDQRGIVVARGHYPEAFGDLRMDSIVESSLSGVEATGVLPGKFRNGDALMLVSAVPIRPALQHSSSSPVAEGVLSGGIRLDKLALRLSKLSGSLVEIRTPNATVTSTGSPFPPVREGRKSGIVPGWDNREKFWWSEALPIEIEKKLGVAGTVIGEIRILVPATERIQAGDRLIHATIRDGALAILIAALSGLLLALGPTRRLEKLTRAAIRIGSGDLETPVEVSGSDEIGILGQTLSETTSALREERARLAKSERIAAWREAARRLAHELKNAITPIGLSLNTVKRAMKKGDEGKAVAEEAILAVGHEMNQLSGLVGEFSKFARLPEPRLKDYDLEKALKAAVTLYGSQSDIDESKLPKIEIIIPNDLPSIKADEELLSRVWTNLISNAVHAVVTRERRGANWVRIKASASGQNSIFVEITDSGPGLPDERIGSSSQADVEGVTAKKGGWGVGLALVERIVIEHGGELVLSNEISESGGAQICVRLPTHSAPIKKENI